MTIKLTDSGTLGMRVELRERFNIPSDIVDYLDRNELIAMLGGLRYVAGDYKTVEATSIPKARPANEYPAHTAHIFALHECVGGVVEGCIEQAIQSVLNGYGPDVTLLNTQLLPPDENYGYHRLLVLFK